MSRHPSRDRAEQIAIQALTFLVSDEERLARFLALSGLDPAEIRRAAAMPDFLSGVLRHIMEGDRLAEAFARDCGLSAEALLAAASACGAGGWEREVP